MKADHHCIDCDKLIWKNKSMKCSSCLRKGRIVGWCISGKHPNIGKKRPPETIMKIKLATKKRKERDGYINSPKARKKISEARKRKPQIHLKKFEFKKGEKHHGRRHEIF